MKIILKLFLLMALLSSCNKKESALKEFPEEKKSEDDVSIKIDKEILKEKNILGYYTGDFIAEFYNENSDYTPVNRITISIDSLTEERIFGHSIVAGNFRPFSGAYTKVNNVYSVDAVEPGDDKYDGKFNFVINSENRTLKGIWNSFDKKLQVTKRNYDLIKKEFRYNPGMELPKKIEWSILYDKDNFLRGMGESLTDDVTKINASAVLLTKNDVENMYKGDLEIIRNSIYARHGYSFKTRKIRYIFDKYVDWYMPVSIDIRDKLTEIEKNNIELIKRYENYADKHYDEFGR